MSAALRRRGLRWQGERDPTPVLVPRGRAPTQHTAMLHHYSYRLFLRDVLTQREKLTPATLCRYVSSEVAARYLRVLQRARLIERSGRTYRLRAARIVSFGGTLEWYVAELLSREFGCTATYGVRIPGAPHGGDYDVVACAEGALLYVETKSAPPRQIDSPQIDAFLDRVNTVRPDMALFLVDTTLRMRDKIVPFLARALRARGLAVCPERLEREVWRVGAGLYVLNADPDLRHALGTALAAHFRARGIAVPVRLVAD